MPLAATKLLHFFHLGMKKCQILVFMAKKDDSVGVISIKFIIFATKLYYLLLNKTSLIPKQYVDLDIP